MQEVFTLDRTSYVSDVAPVLVTIACHLLIVLMDKFFMWIGLKVDQTQLLILSDAAGRAVRSVEAWAAKRAAAGAKPESVDKAKRATEAVKAFLADNNLYQIADEQIAAMIESKLGEDAAQLDDLVKIIHTAKKQDSGN